MRHEELVCFAENFLEKNYGLTLDIPLLRNNRLRSTHGRFVIRNKRAEKLELAGYLLDFGTKDAIIGVLKHECIHYALFKRGLNHRDGDALFEAELKKHSAPKTRTQKIGKYFLLKCSACKKVIPTGKKRVIERPDQYRTACCDSKFTIVGEKIYNGNEKG